ncbi:hypothetical protein ABKV19_012579 [Rosa sericea]
MMISNSNTKQRGRGQNKRFWTTKEDSVLVESLQGLYHDTKWRSENGFKNGYLTQIEAMMEAKMPGCGIQASPHIESRVKTLKKKYYALAEMLSQSGFGWNDDEMMLVCERRVYDEWVQKRRYASGLYSKPFPYYYMLGEIYGKAREVGAYIDNADDDREEFRQEDEDANIDQILGVNDDDAAGNLNLNVDMNVESQSEGSEEFDVSYTLGTPSAQQRRPTESAPSVSDHGRRVKAKVMEEMSKNVSTMSSKIDALVNIFSSDKEVAELQAKLDSELNKIDGLTEFQVFRATNILARQHDLLRVFFGMSEERKQTYVTYLLEHGV